MDQLTIYNIIYRLLIMKINILSNNIYKCIEIITLSVKIIW